MNRLAFRRSVSALALSASLLLGACADTDPGGESAGANEVTTTTAPTPAPDDAAFAERGPFGVGVTALALPDRKVEVWYPTATDAGAGAKEATYSQLDALPPELAAAAPNIVGGVDLTMRMPGTFRDVPSAKDRGPFPLVLFSHGFGSFRLDASEIMAGIASWGFVVAAPDHIERGRSALLSGKVVRDPAKDVQVLLDTLDLVAGAGGELAGLADREHTGVVGHSAGGRAAMNALSKDEIDVAVGWAAAGRDDGPAPKKPSMNIAARVDVLVPLDSIQKMVDGLADPNRLVIIDGAGHNSFTDLCTAVRSGNDLIGVAVKAGLPLPPQLAEGGRDGCTPEAIATDDGFRITQHFTVAQLRDALGVDESGAGLGLGVAAKFAPVTVTYTE